MVLFPLFHSPAHADTPQSIRLPDVLQVAVRQNLSLESARIDIEIARAQMQQSLGIDDILLRAGANYFLRADEAVANNVIGTNGSSLASADVSASKLLSTGGTLSVTATSSRKDSTLSFNNSDVTEYSSELSLRFDQPLLKGRGSAITRAVQDQRARSLSASELLLQGAAQTEIKAIIDAYWELVWAYRELSIRNSALQLAITRRKRTSDSIALGSIPKSALAAIDQVIATHEEDILLAKQTITLRSLELRRRSGLEIGPTQLDLLPEENLRVSPTTFSLQEVVKSAFQTSPELASLAKLQEGATIAVQVADNGVLPRLDLNLSAGPLGTSDSFGDSLVGLGTVKGYFVGGGLSFQKRLGQRSSKGLRAEAVARVSQVRLRRRDLKAQLASAAATAVQTARIAQKRMALSQRVIGLSEQNIETEKRRFESGRSTNFDVLERQEELKQGQLRYARASLDYMRAATAIDALRGQLLSKYGIAFN